jgi:hypothetical protein
MTTTPMMYTAEAKAIIREGWQILVEQLGLQKATQFVVLLERGTGDAVKEITDYWGDATIDEVYQRVMAWKAQQPSASHPT